MGLEGKPDRPRQSLADGTVPDPGYGMVGVRDLNAGARTERNEWKRLLSGTALIEGSG